MADALLEPTVIYVRAVLALLRSDIAVHGLAHITGGGLRNLLRLGGERLGFAIEEPLPVPAICTLVAQHGDVPTAEMWDVFNMGCGFVALVPEERAADAVALLGAQPPGDRAHRHGDRRGRAAVGAGAVGTGSPRRACGAARRYCRIEGRSQRSRGAGGAPGAFALVGDDRGVCRHIPTSSPDRPGARGPHAPRPPLLPLPR